MIVETCWASIDDLGGWDFQDVSSFLQLIYLSMSWREGFLSSDIWSFLEGGTIFVFSPESVPAVIVI